MQALTTSVVAKAMGYWVGQLLFW